MKKDYDYDFAYYVKDVTDKEITQLTDEHLAKLYSEYEVGNLACDLYEKVKKEYTEFIDNMRKQDADYLIRVAYEIVWKENIYQYIESESPCLSKEQYIALLSAPNTLHELYCDWLSSSELYTYDDIETLLEDTAGAIIASKGSYSWQE